MTSLPASSDQFGTPWELFDELHEEFDFTIDAAASATNTKMLRFFSEADDAFKQTYTDEIIWCNPPYNGAGTVRKWVSFFHHIVCEKREARLCAILVPTKTEQSWFHDLCWNNPNCEVRFVRGRIQFIGGATTARDSHMILIFRRPRRYT